MLSTHSRSILIENLIQQEQNGESFYIGDLTQIHVLYNQWTMLMPRVEPFYAIKCNPNSQLLECLSKLPNIGFDCASAAELSLALNLDVPKDKIIYANTSKGIDHLKFAKENRIKMMTFDNESELVKIKSIFPEAELVIRIQVEEFGSAFSLKEKFGASLKDSEKLLQVARNLSINVIGVSFHVGSECKSSNAYYHAIKNCRQLFDFAKNELGFNFTLLDLGGGFSSIEKESPSGLSLFEKMACTIKEALDEFFPDVTANENLRIIAEPGRYFAQRVFTLAVSVSSKKLWSNESQILSIDDNNLQIEKIMYYVNEGVYSAFMCILFDHKDNKPSAVFTNGKLQFLDDSFEHIFKSVIWGPTCDGGDCVSREIKLPQLEVGDWLIFDNFGAYTMAVFCNFNGFSLTKIHWVN